MGDIFAVVLVIAFFIAVFFVAREAICWHLKINERVELLKRIADRLDKIK